MYAAAARAVMRVEEANVLCNRRVAQCVAVAVSNGYVNPSASHAAWTVSTASAGDHKHSIIDWKTSSARYPDQPAGLLALDQQLVCYSWITNEPEVAFVVFVRKRSPEVQYLRTRITTDQRQQFGQLVEETVGRIEAGQFLPRSGIRFPQNPCLSCAFLGLCLGNQQLIEAKLNRCSGAEDFAWLDELHY
jgi:hypothetical protein